MSEFARVNQGIANSVTDLVGETPLVRLGKMNTTHADILLKLESENPMASVKDRLALSIIRNAEKDGKITPGKTVLVETTSGNTGVALAQLGAALGYKVIVVMPEHMSVERRALIRIFGAELHLTPAGLGIKGAMRYAKKLMASLPDVYEASQFSTEYNALVHRETTGPEIWRQTGGKLDVFIAGVGTGGTVTGVAQFLKSQGATTRIVAVEPAASAVLSGEKPGPHKLMGIGAGFVPPVMDTTLLDEIVKADQDAALDCGRRLATEEGLFLGLSSGAALSAALTVGARDDMKGKTIVVVMPSFGERYLSTVLFKDVFDEVVAQPTVPASEIDG